ncbi:Putative periplasmic protein YibQ [Rhodovulum sp. PH10]|uniref:divergent polysaccharide deacetylase family protein n=1 Tax=Rhodovulum sp. PH10 TaxID=1187851 RepID=UPI00027C2891|nr:divergent polysaccharide deacetylase family protein [Rhodovulum sp. PH10]EJW13035.1 Putative periplasmic protein YibQ [Rhodovulum sp. PH10]
MASDDLETPLGVTETRKRRSIPIGLPVTVLLALCLLGFLGWAAFVKDPLGGEPMAVVALPDGTAKPDAAAKPDEAAKQSEAGAPEKNAAGEAHGEGAGAGDGHTVTIIDGSTGKRQDVRIPSDGSPAGLAQPAGENADHAAAGTPAHGEKPAPAKAGESPSNLLEASRHGMLPRIGLDGARPSVAYAEPTPAGTGAKIAIVVAGLGVSPTTTAAALKELPPAVTLAFLPYGDDLARLVGQARAEKHEVLLQVPMEPFDYPDDDPGPQTLLTSLAGDQNVDRMQWAMGRFQGYVGIMNFMGGRFTSTETAVAPMLREVAKRGLLYVDDGASPRSLAGQIAGANNLPFAKGTVVLDEVPSNAEMDRAFERLETTARESGSAVGIARALPLSIERIAAWAQAAEGRGFVVVPITAVAVKAKPT